MSDRTVGVVYVIGKGRSGSTLVDRVLGELDGFFSVGELWRLWDWGLRRGYDCGCGRPVPDCPLWTQVLAAGGFERADTQRMIGWQDAVYRWTALPGLLRAAGRPRPPTAIRSYAEATTRLYRAIAAVTGAHHVVDSSKWPAHPGLLGLVDGIEASAVHLVRDPRAVTHSWTRRKALAFAPDGEEMPRFGPLYSSASWLARNGLAEIVRGRAATVGWLTVRYEDFVADPRGTTVRIATSVGAPAETLPFADDRTALLGPHHMIGANPSREAQGLVAVEPDEGWRTRLRPFDRVVTTAVALPLLHRYGYPLRPGPAS